MRRKRSGQKRRAERVLQWTLVAVLAVLSAYLVSRLAAPYLVSSSLVRSAMERAVAEWTGHTVRIDGTPEISFFPEPRITLNAVQISKPTADGDKVLAEIERLSASFGLLDAVGGAPEFREFRLVRPHVFVERDAQGRLDWASEGRLSSAVKSVRPREGGHQTLEAAADAEVGSVTVEEGSIAIHDQASRRTFVIDGILADISWPRLSSTLTAYATLRIGGREARLDLSTPQPLLFFGGREASVGLAWSSPILTASFDGRASIAGDDLVSGTLKANIADVKSLAALSGTHLPGIETARTASVSAELLKAGRDLRFDQLDLTVDDAHATGILELSPPERGRRRLSGTLAFDHVDITRLLDAFSQKDGSGEPPVRQLDFDLSLSAGEAQLASFTIENIAASLLATRDKIQFDIADGTFASGRLQVRLDGAGPSFAGGGALQLSLADADLSDLGGRLALKGPLPSGRGSLDLALKADRPIWAAGPAAINGTMRFAASAGALRGVDPVALRRLAGEKPFFHLSEARGADLPFDTLVFAAHLSAGSATIDEARLEGPSEGLQLSGIIPYASQALALSAVLSSPSAAGQTPAPPLRFFIGGSWPDPVLSPAP